MKFVDFLTANWSQITVIIGALGYLLKLIFDFNIRKKEIKFEYLYKEKASSFQDFLISYQAFQSLLTTQAYSYKYGNSTFQDFESTMNQSKAILNEKLNALYMYCTQNEKEGLFAILNSCTFVLFEINKNETEEVERILQANTKKSNKIIDKFIKNLHV